MKAFVETGKKIVGIGRNFKAHALELGNAAPIEVPLVFLKPTSSYLTSGNILLPKGHDIHHEVELAVIIGKAASNIRKLDAMAHVAGYALSLDMTARNVQKAAQKAGEPWTIAKGFDTFTPIGPFIPKQEVSDPHNLSLWCKVDESLKQKGHTKDMIFKIPFLLEYVSSIMKLEPGDVILTGTPEGVGSLKHGETITCGLRNDTGKLLSTISFKAVNKS